MSFGASSSGPLSGTQETSVTHVHVGPLAPATHLQPPIVHCLKHTLLETYAHGLPTPVYALRSQRSGSASADASAAGALLEVEQRRSATPTRAASKTVEAKVRMALT